MTYAITGIDGVGKSTKIIPEVVRRINNASMLGHMPKTNIVVNHVPTARFRDLFNFLDRYSLFNDPMKKRELLYETYAHAIDNYTYTIKCITDMLKGNLVISDRWWFDVYAYDYTKLEMCFGDKIATDILNTLYPEAYSLWPDKCFLCVIDPETASRLKPDYPADFMEKVHRRYIEYCAPTFHMIPIDAADPEKAAEEIAREIILSRTSTPVQCTSPSGSLRSP